MANKIKLLRQHKAWSQSHLADAAGLSIRTIQRLEKHGECSQETLLCVASAFDVEVKEFTRLIEMEQAESDQFSNSLLGINRKDNGLWFSLRNWFSNKNKSGNG